MFRIVCFVDDKNLAPIMHGLAGLAKGLEVVPVANVEPQKNGKLRSTGDLMALFAKYLDSHPGEVTPDYLRGFQTSIGRAPGGYNNTLAKAQAAKLLRKSKKDGNGYVYARIGK